MEEKRYRRAMPDQRQWEEEYMAAFNFANENEANILRNILLEKIELRKIRREGFVLYLVIMQQQIGARTSATVDGVGPQQWRQFGAGAAKRHAAAAAAGARARARAPAAPPAAPYVQPVQQVQPVPAKTNHSLGSYTLKSNKKQKGRKLTKADIGVPQNFKHISHVGWDANKGFDLDNAPNADELRSFFTKAGVSETQLQDQETREFIYDFIEMNGGLTAVKQDLDNVKSKY
ncbi:hypothetical protein HF086_008277 [Spodoptera exigua]|uniref:CRIB domain-containing protein n=1 Tax=Spodoptera exigua TaxID=7107 RepID=A0A922SEW8_SPOEX|nr:hypothetical protein HF086_008277 [Spodoptera exigua]